MKITITSHGTRGDVQPYLALAAGLVKAGHEAILCTSANYTEWIESYGVNAFPTSFSMQEFMKKPEVAAVLEGRNLFKKLVTFQQMMRLGPSAMDTVWKAVRDADYIIQSPTSSGALEAAQKLGRPAALAIPVPFAPTRAFPSVFLGRSRFSLGGTYNRLTHALMQRAQWSSFGGPMSKAMRREVGLPALRSFAEHTMQAKHHAIPTLFGFSEHVLARPPDWDSSHKITGYWFLDSPENWVPDPALVRFIEDGPPPVYVGYGSITAGKSEETTHQVLKALEITGQRGVILTGWGGLCRMESSENVYFVDNVPHDWLFPRMAAVVHHGGAGTSGAGFRAGVPSVITPIAVDQYFWAERAVALGVGPRAPSAVQLSAEKLSTAIQTAIHDETIRARAFELGKKIRAENGIQRAVEIIEAHANRSRL